MSVVRVHAKLRQFAQVRLCTCDLVLTNSSVCGARALGLRVLAEQTKPCLTDKFLHSATLQPKTQKLMTTSHDSAWEPSRSKGWSRKGLQDFRIRVNSAWLDLLSTHRLHSSSFWGLPYNGVLILSMNHKKELLWSLYRYLLLAPQNIAPSS